MRNSAWSRHGFWAPLSLCAVLASACGGESNNGNESAGGNGGTPQVSGGSAGAAQGGGGTAGQGSDSEFGPAPTEPPGAVDLLFVVDSSISMADKQQLLRDAVPALVRRLITPNCVDESGTVLGSTDASGACAAGKPEFAAVADLHLGVITSSLGGHGGEICSQTADNPLLDDHGHLLPSVRPGLNSYEGNGFLSWDPGGNESPQGETDPAALIDAVQDHVSAASEVGCGYESTLEAWYRFLIDPEPAESIAVEDGMSTKVGVDQTVLAQRAAFLRPNSLVGIVILTDENDCSIIDAGLGHVVGTTGGGARFFMPRSTSACATDPNDACCRSCASGSSTPTGCEPVAEDPECQKDPYTDIEDSLNLRCFDQKRRFGFDLLQPIERYVQGLSEKRVPNRTGELVPNPLFAEGRHVSRVFLAGAVGVPWQDISDEASWTGPGLELLTASELEAEGRWDVILGDPEAGVPPSDPLMIESVDPRAGTHPLLNAAVAPSTSTDPQENPINGHEQVATRRDDLQYACIFPLPEPRDCSNFEPACQCTVEDIERNRPICQPPGGGAAGTMQYFAKAYPGVRHLQLMRALGERSIVGSVCPKILDGDVVQPSYGYNPLAHSIVDFAASILGSDR